MDRRLLSVITLIILLCSPVFTMAMIHDPRAIEADLHSAQTPNTPKLSGLGQHSHPVTTQNADSQYFFNQGLRLTYSFNHSEALRSFKEVVRPRPKPSLMRLGPRPMLHCLSLCGELGVVPTLECGHLIYGTNLEMNIVTATNTVTRH